MSIYDSINVKTYLNPRGTITMVGGSLMRPEVLDAMVEASRNYVSIPELQQKAKLTLVSSVSIVEGGAHDVVLKTPSKEV